MFCDFGFGCVCSFECEEEEEKLMMAQENVEIF